MGEENSPAVPELARRATLSSSRHDPVRVFAPVLTAMPAAGIPLGDILADSGYAHRDAGAWALPLRRAGARLVQDLHPHDRGPKGTHDGAIIANGNLYCPKTPRPLLELGPLARNASPGDITSHDANTAELARYKLGRITADDADGYHRVQCPAAMGKIRCPLRPASMTLDRDRPEILTPPENPPACCTRQTLTVPPQVTAKTAQKHDYPSQAHRRSYARRTGAERGFATAKDPASNDISRGWCRLIGADPPDAGHHLPARRPEPAHPAGLGRPAGGKRKPRRQRPAPENPAPAPQNTHGTRRRAALTPAALDPPCNHGPRRTPDSHPGPDHSQRQHAKSNA